MINPSEIKFRGTGYREGFEFRGVTFGTNECDTLRQVDRILFRVVCQNYEQAIKLAGGNEPEELLRVAWTWLELIYKWGWVVEANYQIDFEQVLGGDGGVVEKVSLSFALFPWDEATVEGYRALCERFLQ